MAEFGFVVFVIVVYVGLSLANERVRRRALAESADALARRMARR